MQCKTNYDYISKIMLLYSLYPAFSASIISDSKMEIEGGAKNGQVSTEKRLCKFTNLSITSANLTGYNLSFAISF